MREVNQAMTLNIFSMTITIHRRENDLEKVLHLEQAKKLYEQNKDQQVMVHHLF